MSPHQVGLSDVLAALRFSGSAPAHVVLIGVQPVFLDLKMELSPPVVACMDQVLDLVTAELFAIGNPAQVRSSCYDSNARFPRHSRESGNPRLHLEPMDSRFRGNDGWGYFPLVSEEHEGLGRCVWPFRLALSPSRAIWPRWNVSRERFVSLMLMNESVVIGDFLSIQSGAFAVEKVPSELAEEALAYFAQVLEGRGSACRLKATFALI